MLKKLKDYTNRLTNWQKTREDCDSVIHLLDKKSYIIKERTMKGVIDYAVFINYEAKCLNQ